MTPGPDNGALPDAPREGADRREATALPDLTATPSGAPLFALPEVSDLEFFVEVPLGNVDTDVGDLVRLRRGTILRLDRTTGDPLTILANGTPIASGEVRVQGERFAVRITQVRNAPRRDETPGSEVPHAQKAKP
ncbi:MAG: flagellar motor switch protein FliN [Gemmatimonadetes bacterium]|nr:flagellar motor switch protein FliN [Gemmatimonadota bacterium]